MSLTKLNVDYANPDGFERGYEECRQPWEPADEELDQMAAQWEAQQNENNESE